ncbi:MAG TPA: DUF697 domain-containing protein [Oscillatoriaceae cyanobacterium]
MPLPSPVNELWNVWRDLEGHTSKAVIVNLYGAPGTARDAIRELFLNGSQRPGALRVLDLPTDARPEADLNVVVLDPSFGPTHAELATLRKLDSKSLVIVLMGGDPRQGEARRREVATSVGVKPDQIVMAPTLTELRQQLVKRVLERFEEETLPLARQFPFLREEAANSEIRSTAQQNALVGVIPVPGADMPVMTANQIKMVLRLAAIYDQTMSVERAREVLVVLGGGFAFRTVARQLAKFVPGPGWIVGGAVGYSGTLALGKAAIEYFRHVAAPVEPLRRTPEGAPIIDTDARPVEQTES